MPNNDSIFDGDKGEVVFTRGTQLVYDGCFRAVVKRGQIQAVNRVLISRFFSSNLDHRKVLGIGVADNHYDGLRIKIHL